MSVSAPRSPVDSVLAAIRKAQDGHFTLDRGGRSTPKGLPAYSVALREIQAGCKRSHWIWYVWPSLAAVRPRVRFPMFLIPGMVAAGAYLRDDVLRGRLVEVTAAAAAHLDKGVPPSTLFGKMHRYDAPKFVETLTVFAAAAGANGDAATRDTCIAGLEAFGVGGDEAQELRASALRATADSVKPDLEAARLDPRLRTGEWADKATSGAVVGALLKRMAGDEAVLDGLTALPEDVALDPSKVEGAENNVLGYMFELDTAMRVPGVTAMGSRFSAGGKRGDRVEADVVACHGLAWIEVKAIQSLEDSSAGAGAGADATSAGGGATWGVWLGIKEQLQRAVRCAAANPCGWDTPVVVVRFLNPVSDAIRADIERIGVRVWAPRDVSASDGGGDRSAAVPGWQSVLPSVSPVDRAMLDTTTLCTLVSEVLNGDPWDDKVWAWAKDNEHWNAAVMDERRRREHVVARGPIGTVSVPQPEYFEIVPGATAAPFTAAAAEGHAGAPIATAGGAAAARGDASATVAPFAVPPPDVLPVASGSLLEQLVGFLATMRRVIVTQDVVDAFENILKIAAGDRERHRWFEVWKPRLDIVPSPSGDVGSGRLSLVPGLSAKHVRIFSAGEAYRAVTVTSNAHLQRQLGATGIVLPLLVHRPHWLVGL